MNFLPKYFLFCLVAIVVNLATQRILLGVIFNSGFIVALLFGTITGLITKYYLDKIYIFKDLDRSIKNNSKKFLFYSLNGIGTTVIFWATESLFYFLIGTSLARELGAIIGLSIGYFIKYSLDKKYVFGD